MLDQVSELLDRDKAGVIDAEASHKDLVELRMRENGEVFGVHPSQPVECNLTRGWRERPLPVPQRVDCGDSVRVLGYVDGAAFVFVSNITHTDLQA